MDAFNKGVLCSYNRNAVISLTYACVSSVCKVVIEEDDKFLKLLELLGIYQEDGKRSIAIYNVKSQ